MAEVLIVAGNDDIVANRLARAVELEGRQVLKVDGPTAARLFTISGQSTGSSIQPDLPMFVRNSAWWTNDAVLSRDSHFIRAEQYAAFWAAAALMESIVVNRPRLDGVVGRLTSSALARQPRQTSSPSYVEWFASGPEMIDDVDGSMWGENWDFISAPITQLPPRIPVRARSVDICAGYEIVAVVGTRGFAATDDVRSTRWNLVAESIKLAQRENVHFATVTWAIDDQEPTAVRLSDSPDEYDLCYAWKDVAVALCEDLLS